MDTNWFLLGVVIFMSVALLITNVYILVYFQHEDDRNTAYFPKFLVIFGLLFTEATVLLLPLDVANNSNAVGCKEGWNKTCGNINMDILWTVVFMSVIIFIVLLIPSAIYYYEADEGGEEDAENPSYRVWEMVKLEIATLLVVVGVVTVCFITVSRSQIPYRVMELNSTGLGGFHEYNDSSPISTTEMDDIARLTPLPIFMTIDVSFPVYVTGLVSFVGWFGFTVFAGIGLIAMPLDLILGFIYRPQFISADVYAHQKLVLQKRSQELIELGRSIKANMSKTPHGMSSSERKKQKKLDFVSFNKFKQAVYLLENDAIELKLCHEEYKNYNPLVAFLKLILGILSAIISFIWVLHIAIYMIPPTPVFPFLNSYFMWFDNFFPLFGTLSVGAFSTYLLMCVVVGCFKFGMRCFCFSLHPMKLHGTYMNSMLFNLGMVLFCAIPVVQFCDQAFKDYGRLTAIRTMMGVQIYYLEGMRWFWQYNVFVYGILAFTFLAGCYLSIRPRDNASPVDDIRKKIEKQARAADPSLSQA